MTNKYWNTFYNKNDLINYPSNFAKYVYNKYLINKKINLLDIGCGNGRDSFFFAKKKISVTAIDSSSNIIKKNTFLSKRNNNLNFKLLNIQNKKINKLGKFDTIYSRFFLHTINNKIEKNFFDLIILLSKKNKTLVMLEFRTIKDEMLTYGRKISQNENFTDHYRRFIETDKLINKIKLLDKFKILYNLERRGLSKFKKDNPTVARIILKRNNKG